MPKEDLILSALKLLLALPVVILLAYISLRLSNKYIYKQNISKGIQVIERVPVFNKSMLCIIKILDEYMVIGVGENTFQPIKTLSPEEVEKYLRQKQDKDFVNEWGKGIMQGFKREKQHE